MVFTWALKGYSYRGIGAYVGTIVVLGPFGLGGLALRPRFGFWGGETRSPYAYHKHPVVTWLCLESRSSALGIFRQGSTSFSNHTCMYDMYVCMHIFMYVCLYYVYGTDHWMSGSGTAAAVSLSVMPWKQTRQP